MIDPSIRPWLGCLLAIVGCVCPAHCQDGLRQVSGQHIRLTTDLDSDLQCRNLVASFDAAVPQWESFWQLPPGTLDDWIVQACVMRDRERFQQADLIPSELPEFPFGYALGTRIWVINQESEYYTRHLLLHEGVHALAFSQFGGAGPSWFMEGSAELLSVHQGIGAEIQINRIPAGRDATPYWGRFKLMTRRRDQQGIPSLSSILDYPVNLKSDVESYGWSWAAAMLLTMYPEYRPAFVQAARRGDQPQPAFNARLRQALPDWPILVARWRLLCRDLDYGFDRPRERVDLSIQDRLWDGQPRTQRVVADQGWQSLGVRLAPGTKLRLEPSGRVSLDTQPKPWISEPPGITFQYHRGRPLGQLLAVLVPNVSPDKDFLPDLQVQAITEPTTIQIPRHSWLLLRINDWVGKLDDNEGAYQVQVSRGS